MRLFLWTILFLAMATACAVQAPPSGGPEDKTPPKVVATVPASDSAGVSPESEISITFDEDMTRRRVERLLQLFPPIEIGSVSWKGRTIRIRPASPLHPDTTYYVILAGGYRDNHRVANKDEYRFAFATSAAIDSGTISGRVYFKREPTSKAVVRCFVLPVDSGFQPAAARPDRETTVDKEGEYELGYLPTVGDAFIVWAFEDANQNGMYAPGSEAAQQLPDTVRLMPNRPHARERNIFIIDPNEPAQVAGVVVNRSGLDTLAVSVGLYADSAISAPSYLTSCDTTGVFEFGSVKAGAYALFAFVDVVRDSVCGSYPCPEDSSRTCAEPCTQYPDSLFLEPGGRTRLDTLYLEPPVE
jgi:hypothetical protein